MTWMIKRLLKEMISPFRLNVMVVQSLLQNGPRKEKDLTPKMAILLLFKQIQISTDLSLRVCKKSNIPSFSKSYIILCAYSNFLLPFLCTGVKEDDGGQYEIELTNRAGDKKCASALTVHCKFSILKRQKKIVFNIQMKNKSCLSMLKL